MSVVRRHHKLAAALAPAFAAFLLMQACGGSDDAIAQAAVADPLEGVWEGSVTLRDCTTSAPVATFQGSQMFHQGGTMSDANSSPIASRGPGFGTWVKSGSNYIVKFRFFTYDSAGNYSGVIRTTRTVTPGATAGTVTSVNSSQIFDASGTLVRSTCGTDVGTRVL
jgi:hypothetical protein